MRVKLASTLVGIDSIPTSFKSDFQLYFFGETLLKEESILFACPHDIKMWIRLMFNKYNR
jgi:hypothetical protein